MSYNPASQSFSLFSAGGHLCLYHNGHHLDLHRLLCVLGHQSDVSWIELGVEEAVPAQLCQAKGHPTFGSHLPKSQTWVKMVRKLGYAESNFEPCIADMAIVWWQLLTWPLLIDGSWSFDGKCGHGHGFSF